MLWILSLALIPFTDFWTVVDFPRKSIIIQPVAKLMRLWISTLRPIRKGATVRLSISHISLFDLGMLPKKGLEVVIFVLRFGTNPTLVR